MVWQYMKSCGRLPPFEALLPASQRKLLWLGRDKLVLKGKKGSGTGPTLIQRLCPELDTGAIGTRALAGEGTHFNIISGIRLKAIQDDRWFRRSDEEFGGAAWAVDVFVLQSVFHYLAISLWKQNGFPDDLDGGGCSTLCVDTLRVATRHSLVCGDFFHCLLPEAHLVTRREAESVRGSLMDLFSSVVVLPLGELDDRQRIHVFAAKAEAVALQGAVGDGWGVPLQESCAHVGRTDH